ncbi:MAG: IS982 family transposase [Pseudanabaena sp. M57BS1SP1A06MG]|nr:IS982 family transposase [Pseudanabaena sp. M57BS1SP1A06MG]
MCLLELYCSVDDFWKSFEQEWNKHLIDSGKLKRGPEPELTTPEMMTIVILYHQSDFRTFKHFYFYVCNYLKKEFPRLISYSRFVHLMKSIFVPLFSYLSHLRGMVTGIAFIDSTSITVCHNKRIQRNKVFKGLAKRGKSTSGWFYGFKLHLIINDRGEILAFQLTPGNVSDVSMAENLSKNIFGKLFGDKGYISSDIAKSLLKRGLELFTSIRANMKQKLMSLTDKILLRKRSLIETVNDQLKNISQIEHTRHRSLGNFLVNMLGGIAAYCHQPKKPSLKLSKHEAKLLMAT